MRHGRSYVATGVAATALASLVAGLTGTPASAAPGPQEEVLAQGLDGPLQLDATDHGIYFSQSNLSELKSTKLSKLRRNGTVVDLITLRGANVEIAGVDTRGDAVAFTVTRYNEENPAAKLRLLQANGVVRTLADLRKVEERRNPDGDVSYGITDLPAGCQVPEPFQPYEGIVDSHPYSVANGPDGSWYVADAAANAIFQVLRNGDVRTAAVLPPQPTEITEQAAQENGLPDCVVGSSYNFEPVPTDVVVRGGSLFVTLLPGGPEDPSLGARGSLVEVDRSSGAVEEVADGFLAATNLALAGPNKAYVTELFGGSVTQVNLTTGATSTYAERELPSAVDVLDGDVYVTEAIFGPPGGSGRIVRLGGPVLVD